MCCARSAALQGENEKQKLRQFLHHVPKREGPRVRKGRPRLSREAPKAHRIRTWRAPAPRCQALITKSSVQEAVGSTWPRFLHRSWMADMRFVLVFTIFLQHDRNFIVRKRRAAKSDPLLCLRFSVVNFFFAAFVFQKNQ